MSSHAPYSPSKLPFLALCPGWQSDPTPGPMAMRGTAIHGIIAGQIKGLTSTGDADHWEVARVGLEMFHALKERFPDHTWMAEEKVDSGIPGCFGTADLIGISEWSPVAILVDWKTSRGDRDDAGKSLQVAGYALGVIKRWAHVEDVLCIMGELEQQPTEATWTRKDLATAEKTITSAIIAARLGSEEPLNYRPTPKACQYCARRTGCPALARSVGETAAQVPANPVESVRALSPADLAAALKRYTPAAKLVADYIDALQDRAKELLAADPSAVPGFALKESNGTRGWTAPEDVVRSELASIGADLMGLVSPAEAEKRIAEKIGGKGAKKAAADAIKGLCKPQVRKSLVEV